MRKCALILLLTLPLFGSQPAIATDLRGQDDLLRSVRPARGMCRNVLPGRLRNEEGNKNVLVHRVQGDLSPDARLSSRMLRMPTAASLRAPKMREEAG